MNVLYERVRISDRLKGDMIQKYLFSAGLACLCLFGCGGAVEQVQPSDSAIVSATSTQNFLASTTLTFIDPISEPLVGILVTRVAGLPQNRPSVTTTLNGTTSTVSMDFGAGLTDDGGIRRAGVIKLIRNTSTNTGSIAFENYSVEGRSVSGSATLTNIQINTTSLSATMSYNIAQGTNNYFGTQNYSYSGGASKVSGSGQASLDGTLFQWVATNLTYRPTVNRSWVPDGGTLDFEYPGFGTTNATYKVQFSGTTPATKNVSVIVNGQPARTFQLLLSPVSQ